MERKRVKKAKLSSVPVSTCDVTKRSCMHAYRKEAGVKEAKGLTFIIHEAFTNGPKMHSCQKMLPKENAGTR